MDPAHFALYAHTLPNAPREKWEPLDEDVSQVAQLCQRFAAEFGAGEWGWIAGRCHDIGKASDEFQHYLNAHNRENENAGEESSAGRVDHSTCGARFVASKLPGPFGRLLAFCIAGHHAGLPNAFPVEDQAARSSLAFRLDPANPIPRITEPSIQFHLPKPSLKADAAERAFSIAFFTR